MSYIEWFNRHANKHKVIVEKLLDQGYSSESIIEYFDFENMKREEFDFCPLYAKDKKCHDMEHLNCYLCACPNFRFDDSGIKEVEGATQFSFCNVTSQDGQQALYGDKIHQDCSKCTLPHHSSYIESSFESDWSNIMRSCAL